MCRYTNDYITGGVLKITVRARLLASLAALTLAIVAVGAAGLKGMDDANSRISTIVADRVVPMDQLKTIADMYAVNIVDTANKASAGRMDWAQAQSNIDQAKAKI